jgi:hypothetical protein
MIINSLIVHVFILLYLRRLLIVIVFRSVCVVFVLFLLSVPVGLPCCCLELTDVPVSCFIW